jgi:hypothetical protein
MGYSKYAGRRDGAQNAHDVKKVEKSRYSPVVKSVDGSQDKCHEEVDAGISVLA